MQYTTLEHYKTQEHLYADLKTPSLHGNNSEFGAEDVMGRTFQVRPIAHEV